MSEEPKSFPDGESKEAGQAIEDIDDIDEAAQEETRPTVDEATSSPVELTQEENRVIESLAELGIQFRKREQEHLTFARAEPGVRFTFSREPSIPRSQIPDLLAQLASDIVQHPTFMGFLQPSVGYAEVVVSDSRRGIPSSALERLVSLPHDFVECSHAGEGGKSLPVTPFTSRVQRPQNEVIKRVHLASLKDAPCVEISNASPLAMLLYGRISYRILPTIKLDYGKAVGRDSFVKSVDEIARSLIYELDVRNGRVISPDRRRLPREARGLIGHPRKTIDKVRYPQTRLQHEVADLFGFAAQAFGNPPLSFLSYYQTLEYFIPAAIRQSSLKKVRLELSDPMFDRDSDSCLLRVISTAESMVRLPEASQFRTLLREYVRSDRLEEFFSEDWENYFTHRGPIKGVESINLKNSSKDLCDQVADRVYQIRNRIVHAKDDHRYEEARVLLPQSQEAEALGPDVELVRLLATEAIVVGQES